MKTMIIKLNTVMERDIYRAMIIPRKKGAFVNRKKKANKDECRKVVYED